MAVNTSSDSGLSLLWREYKQIESADLRNQLVEAHLELVKLIVNRMMDKAFAKFIGYDEIVAAGNLGLIEAVEGFDPELGIKFETYARARIRGAILDWLREIDWVPRLVRSNARLYGKALSALRGELRQEPTLQDIAEYLHISLEEAQGLQQDARGADTHFQQEGAEDSDYSGMSPLDQIPGRRSPTPLEELTRTDGFDNLIACLTDREQIIFTLYYRDEFTMQRISLVLGLSESRISQAHDEALLKIKDSLFL